MENEELKEKMVKIIINAIWKDAEADYDSTDETEAGSIADALIAAGIGDVKEAEAEANRYEMLYKLQNQDMALAERRAHDAEHRAEVAEDELARHKRALRIAGDKFINEVCNMRGEDISDKCDYKCDTCFYDYYLQQAEKELAEEGKDD